MEGKDKLLVLSFLIFPAWVVSWFYYLDSTLTSYEQCALEMEQTGVDLDCDDDDADWYKKEGYESKTDFVSVTTLLKNTTLLKKTGFGLMSSTSGGG